MKKKNLAFTLAEVLIVIGIIGVVAALTLPNLNHATGDKETVTRLQKAYSILNEANDRAVAIYGPISSWSEVCRGDLNYCWMDRIGEFLKISKKCDERGDSNSENYISCDDLSNDENSNDSNIYQLTDGITFFINGGSNENCDGQGDGDLDNICIDGILVDVNGPNKGKNSSGIDVFRFVVSDKIGVTPNRNTGAFSNFVSACMQYKYPNYCTFWVLDYGNLDYLKADSNGQCNDSNVILDGVTNTSCH